MNQKMQIDTLVPENENAVAWMFVILFQIPAWDGRGGLQPLIKAPISIPPRLPA